MKIHYFLSLSCLFLLVGCQTLSKKPNSEVITPTIEVKDWVFPVTLRKGTPLPKGFIQVETIDGCTLFVFDRKEFGDATIITHFKPGRGKNDFGGGILFRYKNTDNYYCLRYNGNTNNLRFYKSIMGDRVRFANRTVRLKEKEGWHQLKLVTRGDLLLAYVDNKRIFAREDELIPDGKIGLWLRGKNPKTEFADLSIQP